MDKSRVCVSRTINIANQKTCSKTHLLVYEKPKTNPPVEPPPPTHVPRISAPPAKRIRVCTGAELKKICPPKFCDCKPKRTFGFISSFFKLFGLGAKALIAGGIVYLTWDAGVWGDSEQTQKIYSNVCETFAPSFCPEDPEKRPKPISQVCEAQQELMCVPPPPASTCCDKMPIDHEKSTHVLKQSWNRVITCVFNGISGFPNNAIEWGKTAKHSIGERMKAADAESVQKCKDE